ncbi:MAG: hypothetical protein ACRDJO_07220, partial [Actinomycetota bacterium]
TFVRAAVVPAGPPTAAKPRRVPVAVLAVVGLCIAALLPLGILALVNSPETAPPTTVAAPPPHVEPKPELSAAGFNSGGVVSPGGLDAYRGMGAWIDLYDYVIRTQLDAAATAADLKRRGVRTLYMQTGRWNIPADIANASAASVIIEAAHAQGISVVGWYLPGFADLERDVRASLAVLSFRTPSGQGFDGFAADIEDNRAVGRRLAAFNAGVAAYSAKLRAEAPPGAVLGAIVPDAKNNLRAPGLWAGFPWPAIAHEYDVVMPMAYWSVVKRGCTAGTSNAEAYMREVMSLTQGQMGTSKPMHPIGGIANCTTATEIEEYVNVGLEQGWIGGSIYDVLTTNANPHGEGMWQHLRRFNP